jgi:hypothetical protein
MRKERKASTTSNGQVGDQIDEQAEEHVDEQAGEQMVAQAAHADASTVEQVGEQTEQANEQADEQANEQADTLAVAPVAKSSAGEMSLYAKLIPLFIFLAFVLYLVLFSNFGFIVASAIVPPIILALLKVTKWYYYLIVYAFAGVLFVVFRILLRIPIPY